MQQRRPGPLGPGDLGGRQRGRPFVVGDHHRPLDDGVAPEPGGPVVRRRRCRPAPHLHVGAHQALRADQVDPEAGELGRRLVEEQVGPVDVELDGRRFRGLGELGQHVDHLADLLGGVDDGLRQRVEVILVAGELDGERTCLPDVVRAAPPAGIELVDELDGDLPGVERVVGHDEAQARQDDRLAQRSAVVALEAGGERVHLVEMGSRPPAHDRVGVGQRLEHRSRCRRGRAPIGRQVGRPALGDEPVPGEAVDERGVDACHGGLGVTSQADRRHSRLQGRQRVRERAVGDRFPARQAEVAFLDDDGRELAGGDGGGGQSVDGDEPREGFPRHRRPIERPQPRRHPVRVQAEGHRSELLSLRESDVEDGEAAEAKRIGGPIEGSGEPGRGDGVPAVPAPQVQRRPLPRGDDRHGPVRPRQAGQPARAPLRTQHGSDHTEGVRACGGADVELRARAWATACGRRRQPGRAKSSVQYDARRWRSA